MTSERPLTAAESDEAAYNNIKSGDLTKLLQYATTKSGRPALTIAKEFAAMNKSDRKINVVEYVRWKLYDSTRYTPEERAAFISNDLHWPIIYKCCDQTWHAAAEDKVLADTLMRAGGVPVPETIAVIDKSARAYPGIKRLETPDDLRDMMQAHGGTNMFGKIVGGMVSFGAFDVEMADDTQITCVGRPPMTYAEFLSDFVGNNAYIIQKKLVNDDGFAGYCSALATVRMVNFIKDGQVVTPIAVIKMPQGNNIADAFWRHGNLACEVDVISGQIKTVVLREGADMTFLEDHPEKEGLKGLTLPHWDKLLEVNEHAARIFAPLRYQSCDIAITKDGPVMVELNYGGGFDLPQNASGRGLLTPDVRAFFENCGYQFGAQAPKKKGGIFGLFGARK